MTSEEEVLNLLIDGTTPTEAAAKLEISRTTYYTILTNLERKGILSRVGDLPEDAIAELCPPPELPDLFEHVLDWLGWADRGKREIRNFCARYGWLPPLANDRYSRSQWTGHAVRRVDFKGNGIDLMVIGFLVPRLDKLPWDRATPHTRLVYLESVGTRYPFPTPLDRGTVITYDILKDLTTIVGYDRLVNPEDLPPLPTHESLALAVAWVCEGRAILKPV